MSAALSADLLDAAVGIEPGSEQDRLRRQRPAAREHTQRAHDVLLDPREDRGFARASRLAVASFVLQLHQAPPDEPASRGIAALAQDYDDALRALDPALARAVAELAGQARRPGPYGVYREAGLAAESEPGERFEAPATGALGARLAAALTHAALLVLRPREASPDALEDLLDAGWNPEQIVTLSQLVAFLAYQARLAHALAVVADDDPALASGGTR